MSEQLAITAAPSREWVRIIVPGEPTAQGRGRAFAYRDGAGQMRARVFDPAKSRNWKASAQQHMRDALRDIAPFPGPVELTVVAYFTCPRSHWRKREPRPVRWHTQRPDGDNCLKAVKDSAKGVLWIDDCQVARATVEKFFAAQGDAPRVVIAVRPLADPA